MNRSCFSHNNYHLGDCLQSLHLIRALGKEHYNVVFVFFTHGCNLPQLREVVADLPNIILADFESDLWCERQHESVDMWKNFDHFWENSRFRWDWSRFMLEHHDWTANRMGYLSPFKIREHLLLDYPALNNPKTSWREYQFLIGNSKPCSGQFSPMADHSVDYFKPLIDYLEENHPVLITNTEYQKTLGRTITDLGALSMMCAHHIMVASGPFWVTLNTTNHHYNRGRRIAILDNGEQLNMPGIEQVSSMEEVMQIVKEEGWI